MILYITNPKMHICVNSAGGRISIGTSRSGAVVTHLLWTAVVSNLSTYEQCHLFIVSETFTPV